MTPRHPTLRAAVAARLLACPLLLAAATCDAVTSRCVATSTQLADALEEASHPVADTTFIIRIREGLYASDAATGPFRLAIRRAGQLVDVSGGWSGAAGGCDHQSFDPSRTTLIGGPTRKSFYLNLSNALDTGAMAYLHDISFSNPNYTQADGGACLSGLVGSGNSARIDRVQLHDCHATVGSHASMRMDNEGDLTVRNLAARSGSAAENGGIAVFTSGVGTSRLAQISVTGTQTAASVPFGSGITLANFGSSLTHLANSVSWGNDDDPLAVDIATSGAGVVLTRTHYGILGGLPDANLAPGSGDPGFVADGDPRPGPSSPLIDGGVGDPPGGSGAFDCDGHARVVGLAVDIGAFEWAPPADPVFADGFEPPG